MPSRYLRLLLCTAVAIAAPVTTAVGSGPLLSRPFDLSGHLSPGDTFMGIRLLGSLQLPETDFQGLPLRGLSACAWDQDEHRLYLLSDRARLFHTQPRFYNGHLSALHGIDAVRLQNKAGKRLVKGMNDSEGMTIAQQQDGIRGNTLLTVSFERTPRIRLYHPDGRHVKKLRLPDAIDERRDYSAPNKALEAITGHPLFGILTGPERPLKNTPADRHRIFSLRGRQWQFQALNDHSSALVELETLDDGSLLVLERNYEHLFKPLQIALRRVRLDPVDDTAETREIAMFDNGEDWHVDNFEGLCQHRDGRPGQRFFMVSDNNGNPLQKTLLVYFELLPE